MPGWDGVSKVHLHVSIEGHLFPVFLLLCETQGAEGKQTLQVKNVLEPKHWYGSQGACTTSCDFQVLKPPDPILCLKGFQE